LLAPPDDGYFFVSPAVFFLRGTSIKGRPSDNMAGAIRTRDAEYVAIIKANIIVEAETFLNQRYITIAFYGTFALILMLGFIFAAYKIYQVFFRYTLDVKMAGAVSDESDNINNPRDDDESWVPLWDIDEETLRVPTGNQIRNRINKYSKQTGRDLKKDFDVDNDDYEGTRREGWFDNGEDN
jgi:hypothetical protein